MASMELSQIIVLALVQGAAELLPVSSSAHVIMAEKLMGIDPSSPEATFLLVMLHTGTMFAVLFYFWPRWKLLLFPALSAEQLGDGASYRFYFFKMLVLATAITGFLGLGLKLFIEKVVLIRMLGHDNGEVEHLFKNLLLMAGALAAVGLIIIASGSRDAKANVAPLTQRTSLFIGIIQGLCLPFRGFSRSGATISMGLFCGLPRTLAEEFSFALAVVLTPPVISWELYRLVEAKNRATGEGWRVSEILQWLRPGLLGMVFSFVAGLVALRVLSVALERGRWKYFGYYCLAAAGVVLLAALNGL
jgi:undecaprenyl-diphosphatase